MDASYQDRERARLAELYRNMKDGELEKVASEADELADYARELIVQELNRRELPIPESTPHEPEKPSEPQPEQISDDSGDYEIDYQKLVMLRRFRDLPAAMLAKAALDSAGIQSYLTDENMVRMNWFISNGIGGSRLLVKPEDLETAEEVLNQPIPESFDVEGDETFKQPACPRCGSLDITYEDINKPLSYASAAILKFPYPFPRDAWKCNACGVEWQDVPDDPDSAEPDEVNEGSTPE